MSARPDRDALVARYRERPSGAIYFDDLLTPRALATLQRYLLESTIWHDFSHIGGFVASYLEDGLACPLLLQIADELRATFPELLGPHPLTQAWAFKGLEAEAAVDVHADDAAVSVNFWVTPDATPTWSRIAAGCGSAARRRLPAGRSRLRLRPGAHCNFFGTTGRQHAPGALPREPRGAVRVPPVPLLRRPELRVKL